MLWMLIAVPALSGAALLLCGRRADRAAPAAAVTVAIATVVAAVTGAVQRPRVSAPFLAGAPVRLGVDGLSAVLIVTVAAVLICVILFATGDLKPEEPRARFHGLMLIFAAAMLVTVTAQNLLTLLLGWEVMGAISYALIGFHWRDEHKAASGLVAFVTTRAGDLGLYLAAGAMIAGGSLALDLDAMPTLSGGRRDLAAAGIILAALGKSAQLPFSFWLSRAMAGPSPVSALLHSATMVAAGAYLLLRSEPLLAATGWAGPVTAWAGALTAVALGAVAVCQRDLKQLLAASTCAQVGLMVLAAGAGAMIARERGGMSGDGGAIAAGSGYLVAHAAVKSLLFLAAGAWLTALGTKRFEGLRGAARTYPLVGVTFTVGALGLAGVPPFALWPVKDSVLAVARESSTPLYVLGFAAAILSAVYAGRALTLVWMPSPSEKYWDTEQLGTRRVRPAAALPLAVSALAVVAGGIAVLPRVRDRFADTVEAGPAAAITWFEPALSGVVAVVTVAIVAALIRERGDLPAPAPPANWLGLEAAARTLVVAPALTVATLLAAFDDRVLSRGAIGAGRATIAVARVADRRVDGAIEATVAGVATASRGLGRWARRPETGQVHQYYAQAVVALMVLAAVLMALR
ncbi:NADH-quinone oxidoreductase subunit 5 family protein [Nocardia jejuensis]|uniref:NADH-quinone oxidoreductase subunit 5 family protein n=1 Tax=Nocardia jejuensis TaxID=328049 RepID=UPI00083239C1|nr:proton-conducting transporter membrane subunit [Nocardia jejuensis]